MGSLSLWQHNEPESRGPLGISSTNWTSDEAGLPRNDRNSAQTGRWKCKAQGRTLWAHQLWCSWPWQKLDTVIDPLNPAGHPKSGPINIVTGKLAHPAVNVHHSLRLGQVSREAYEKNLPAGFHDTINAGVKTMAYTGSRPKTSSKQVTNPNAIMNRVLPMLSSGDVDLTLMFSTELSEVVTSLFQANGEIRLATDKSKLMQRLASYKSYRTILKPDTVIIDGVAMFNMACFGPCIGLLMGKCAT